MTHKIVKKNPAPRRASAAALLEVAAALDQQSSGGQLLKLVPNGELAADDESTDEYSALNSLMTELEGTPGDNGGKVQVTMIDPNDPTPAYCFECAANEFSLDRIRRNFGKGLYNVKIWARNDDNKGRYGLIYNRRHKIIGDPDPVAPVSDTFTRAEVEAMIAARTTAPVDPFAGLENQFKLMRMYREAMGNPAAPAAAASPLGSLTELVNALKVLRGASEEFAPPSGGGKQSEMSTLIETARPLVSAIAERMAQERAPAPPPAAPHFVPPAARLAAVPTAPRPAVPPAPASPAAPLSAEEESKKMMSLTLAMLCDRAAKNSDVAVCTDFIFEGMTEDDANSFADLLETPAWFDLLKAFHAPVANYQPWFEKLRAECLSRFNPDEASAGAAAVDKKTAA